MWFQLNLTEEKAKFPDFTEIEGVLSNAKCLHVSEVQMSSSRALERHVHSLICTYLDML
jgi:hypothetical protein